MSWPPKPSELCETAVSLPPELDAFLCTLLTGNTEITTEYPHRVRRLVNSFGQDIVYGRGNWRKTETPKTNTGTVRSKNFDKQC